MTVPYSFANATVSIPLSQLDSNFNTPITLGNTAIQLGNTVTTLNNMTLANVTISSGNVTITNVSVTTANVTTLNAATVIATTANVTTANITTGNVTTANIVTANITTGNVTNMSSGNVAITGGSVDGTTIGGTTRAAGSFTTLTLTNALDIANGGTGQTTANAAFNALAPSQTGNAGKYLTTDGTNTSWATNPLGTVTSVDVSGGTTGLTTSGGPITSSGTITLGGTLATTNGGTGLTSFTANRVFYASSTSAIGQSANLTFDGTTLTANALTTSSTVTINGGTANGVAYLNGSKVLTTGSALTFDSATQYLTAPNVAFRGQLSINGGSGGFSQITFYKGTTANTDQLGSILTGDAATPYLAFNARNNAVQIWQLNDAEQMRLTSTGLGIGTSSPAVKLDVNGSVNLSSVGNLTWGGAYGAGIPAIAVPSAGSLGFYPNGSTSGLSMVLNSSGNLGLGVTPSAWRTGSGERALQVGSRAALFCDSGLTTDTLNNVFVNTSNQFIYLASAAASRYQQNAGQHAWYTAPSGTAGNAISFTQALTLDANRNLLLNGTTAGTSSVGTLTIFNGTAPTGSVTDGVILFAQDVSASSELRVRDEAGNVTTLSPHNFELIPEGPSEDMAWAYYSEKNGKKINVDMLKLARMVEKLTGEKLVYEA